MNNFTVSISSQQSRNEWTESLASSFSAGGDMSMSAGRDINLSGGALVDVGGNAAISAGRDILLAAARNTANSESSGWGASFGLRPKGFEIGGSVNSASSSGARYNAGGLNVAGHLSLDARRDLTLLGSTIKAGSADINAERNLTIQTLQDISKRQSMSAGLSVSVGPSGPTGGSANVSSASADSQRSHAMAAITTDGALRVDVGGIATLVGGVLGSRSGEMNFSAAALVLKDLTERARANSASINASFGSNSRGSGGSDFSVSGAGGSYSASALDGTTRATIGAGTVTVKNQTSQQTAALLSSINRDVNNATVITRDTSFKTGNMFLDVGALKKLPDNIVKNRMLASAYSIKAEPTHPALKPLAYKLNEALKGKKLSDIKTDEEYDAARRAMGNIVVESMDGEIRLKAPPDLTNAQRDAWVENQKIALLQHLSQSGVVDDVLASMTCSEAHNACSGQVDNGAPQGVGLFDAHGEENPANTTRKAAKFLLVVDKASDKVEALRKDNEMLVGMIEKTIALGYMFAGGVVKKVIKEGLKSVVKGQVAEIAAKRYIGSGAVKEKRSQFARNLAGSASRTDIKDGAATLIYLVLEGGFPKKKGLGKAEQLRLNKAKGNAYEKKVFDKRKNEVDEIKPEITIKTKDGTKTRLDYLTKKDGKIGCIECKSSKTAPLTVNQRKAFPQIEESGGIIVGKGKSGFEGGTKIPPTKVEIIRPPVVKKIKPPTQPTKPKE